MEIVEVPAVKDMVPAALPAVKVPAVTANVAPVELSVIVILLVPDVLLAVYPVPLKAVFSAVATVAALVVELVVRLIDPVE